MSPTNWRTACLPSLRPILSLIMTGSPNQEHYLKNQSDKKYASGLFAKKSHNPTSYGSEGDTSFANDSQRGFVPLSDESTQSKAFASRVEPKPFSPETTFGQDIEMQGDREAHKGIHVRNDMRVDYSGRGV